MIRYLQESGYGLQGGVLLFDGQSAAPRCLVGDCQLIQEPAVLIGARALICGAGQPHLVERAHIPCEIGEVTKGVEPQGGETIIPQDEAGPRSEWSGGGRTGLARSAGPTR